MNYRLDEFQHNEIYKQIEEQYLSFSQSQNHPIVIITGGQPGSGKSGLTDMAKAELSDRGGFVLIDADKLRGYHPLYKQALQENGREAANLVHQDAGSLAQVQDWRLPV